MATQRLTIILHIAGPRTCKVCREVVCGSLMLPDDTHVCDDCALPALEALAPVGIERAPTDDARPADVQAEYDAGLAIAATNHERRSRFAGVAAEHNQFLAQRGGRR